MKQNPHASMHTTNNYFQTLNSITMRKKYFLLCLAIFTGMATVSAAADGLPVKGYFYWSLLDNFEWQKGFAMQFGLIAVDRAHGQTRAPKPSLVFLGRYAAQG